jgi:hypothetical protein
VECTTPALPSLVRLILGDEQSDVFGGPIRAKAINRQPADDYIAHSKAMEFPRQVYEVILVGRTRQTGRFFSVHSRNSSWLLKQ